MCVPVREDQVMGSFQDLTDLATARAEVCDDARWLRARVVSIGD